LSPVVGDVDVFSELNGRVSFISLVVREGTNDEGAQLDAWSKTWTWTSSPYFLLLSSLTRDSRLYCEHVRLCLNSLALNEGEGEVHGRHVTKGTSCS